MDDPPPYQITFTHVKSGAAECEATLRRIVETALAGQETRHAIINIAIVDDVEIARLNQKHLHLARSTDVLSFDLSGDHDTDSDASDDPRRRVEGQVVVSIETARREANRRQHSFEAELALYVVHGVLHLTGLDDATPRQAKRMHAIEEQVLISEGFPAVFYGEGVAGLPASKSATKPGVKPLRNEHERSGQTGHVRCREDDPSAMRHGRE